MLNRNIDRTQSSRAKKNQMHAWQKGIGRQRGRSKKEEIPVEEVFKREEVPDGAQVLIDQKYVLGRVGYMFVLYVFICIIDNLTLIQWCPLQGCPFQDCTFQGHRLTDQRPKDNRFTSCDLHG
jgi:hypothetical protein